MRFNIFEGARRIALIAGGLWAAGCVAWALFTTPYSRLTLGVFWVGLAPVVVEECGRHDASEYVTRRTPQGEELELLVCFIASQASTGEMLVPYKQAGDGKAWMAGKHSTDVTAYTEIFAKTFPLTPIITEAVSTKKRRAMTDQWQLAVQVAAGGLAIGWAVVAAIGWVVRGFLGIPRGKDSRPMMD